MTKRTWTTFRRADRFLIVVRYEWRWDQFLAHALKKIDVHGFVAGGAVGGSARFLIKFFLLNI